MVEGGLPEAVAHRQGQRHEWPDGKGSVKGGATLDTSNFDTDKMVVRAASKRSKKLACHPEEPPSGSFRPGRQSCERSRVFNDMPGSVL